MKLKDIKADFPKELPNPSTSPSSFQRGQDNGYNQCREEFMNMEIEVDVDKIVEEMYQFEWIVFEGRDVLAIHPEDIAEAIANILPDIIRGKEKS